MYTPRAFADVDADALRHLLRSVGFGHVVTHSAGDGEGLASTPLPFVIDDEMTTVRAHLARANPHWRRMEERDALMIVTGASAYVSPNWYPSKAEHHRVVPTWNYEVIHVRGVVRVHDDPAWTRQLVTDLTNEQERRLAATGDSEGEPWQVTDAPPEFIDSQLRAIVGIELEVTSIDGKRKLSQNKPDRDRVGAIDGLTNSPRPSDRAAADAMRNLER